MKLCQNVGAVVQVNRGETFFLGGGVAAAATCNMILHLVSLVRVCHVCQYGMVGCFRTQQRLVHVNTGGFGEGRGGGREGAQQQNNMHDDTAAGLFEIVS